MPVVCGVDSLLAFAAGGIRLSCCNAITMTAPQAAPTSHDTMMAFVNLHHIVASTVMACRRNGLPQVLSPFFGMSKAQGLEVNALWTIRFHQA